jgi:hypothetical protein
MKKKTIRVGSAVLAGLMICSSFAGCASNLTSQDDSVEVSYAPQVVAETADTEAETGLDAQYSSNNCFLGAGHYHYTDAEEGNIAAHVTAGYEILDLYTDSNVDYIDFNGQNIEWGRFVEAAESAENMAEFLAGFENFLNAEYMDTEYTKEGILELFQEGSTSGLTTVTVCQGAYEFECRYNYDWQQVKNDRISLDNWKPENIQLVVSVRTGYDSTALVENIDGLMADGTLPSIMVYLMDGTMIHSAQYKDYGGTPMFMNNTLRLNMTTENAN